MPLPRDLRDLHERLGARFQGEVPDERIDGYGDPDREDRALHQECGLFHRFSRGILRLTGSERIAFLHGFTTNDVRSLSPGRGLYTALLTPKGQIIADARVLVREGEVLLDTEPGRETPVREFLERHLISEDVEIGDATSSFALFSFLGPRSAEAVSALLGAGLPPLGEHAFNERGGLLVASTRLGALAGLDLLVPSQRAAEILAAAAAHATPVGFAALETARVEAGIPRYGAEMNDATGPLEAGLAERAVSFTKGCYVGQEAVARAHHGGGARRKLVGFQIEAGALPASGVPLFRAAGNATPAGEITTAVSSPRFGAIALGYARREHQAPGSELFTAEGSKAVVCTLPFATAKA